AAMKVVLLASGPGALEEGVVVGRVEPERVGAVGRRLVPGAAVRGSAGAEVEGFRQIGPELGGAVEIRAGAARVLQLQRTAPAMDQRLGVVRVPLQVGGEILQGVLVLPETALADGQVVKRALVSGLRLEDAG